MAPILPSHVMLDVAACLRALNAMIGSNGWAALLNWLSDVADAILIVVDDSASAADFGLLTAQPALCHRLLVVLHTRGTGTALLDSQAVVILQQQSRYMPIRCDTARLETCADQVLRALRNSPRRRHEPALLVGVNRLPARPLLNLLVQLAEVFGPIASSDVPQLVLRLAPTLQRRDVQRALRLAVAMQWLQQPINHPEDMLSRNPQLPLFAGAGANQRQHRLQQLRLQVMAARLHPRRIAALAQVTGHVAA